MQTSTDLFRYARRPDSGVSTELINEIRSLVAALGTRKGGEAERDIEEILADDELTGIEKNKAILAYIDNQRQDLGSRIENLESRNLQLQGRREYEEYVTTRSAELEAEANAELETVKQNYPSFTDDVWELVELIHDREVIKALDIVDEEIAKRRLTGRLSREDVRAAYEESKRRNTNTYAQIAEGLKRRMAGVTKKELELAKKRSGIAGGSAGRPGGGKSLVPEGKPTDRSVTETLARQIQEDLRR